MVCVRKVAVGFVWSVSVLLGSTLASHHSSIQGVCKHGMFDDRQRGAVPGKPNCRPCGRCVPGYGAIRLCTQYNDTECSPCSPGHYSASTSRLDSCIPCTVCGRREPELKACTAQSDAVCRKHCPIGTFYSPLDKDCLPCSSCRNYPQYEANSARVRQCQEDGMASDMQCWPLSGGIDYSEDNNDEPTTTVAYRDYHVRPAAPSPRPGQVGKEDDPDITADTARMYTVILLTLLIVVGLCVILSIIILVCLCRVMKMSSGKARQRTHSGGYQCLSKKTSKLLVSQPTYV